jgi:hypothetical protein
MEWVGGLEVHIGTCMFGWRGGGGGVECLDAASCNLILELGDGALVVVHRGV